MMDLSPLLITHQATVLEEYLDEMGHMNVMWYTHMFDRATWHLFNQVGMDLDYFEDNLAGAFALEQHTRYLAELLLGQQVTLYSRIVDRSLKRLHFMHFMLRDKASILAATTELIGMHIDQNGRRSAPFPGHIAANIDRLLAEHSQVDWPAPICGFMKA